MFVKISSLSKLICQYGHHCRAVLLLSRTRPCVTRVKIKQVQYGQYLVYPYLTSTVWSVFCLSLSYQYSIVFCWSLSYKYSMVIILFILILPVQYGEYFVCPYFPRTVCSVSCLSLFYKYSMVSTLFVLILQVHYRQYFLCPYFTSTAWSVFCLSYFTSTVWTVFCLSLSYKYNMVSILLVLIWQVQYGQYLFLLLLLSLLLLVLASYTFFSLFDCVCFEWIIKLNYLTHHPLLSRVLRDLAEVSCRRIANT